MSYFASKLAKNEDEVSANSTTWVTVAETATINVVQGANNYVRIHAGWIGATAGVTAGAFRILLHTDSTGDTQLGDEIEIPLLTSFSAVQAEQSGGLVAGGTGAAHKAKLQIRAGAVLSSASVPAGQGWIEMMYANT